MPSLDVFHLIKKNRDEQILNLYSVSAQAFSEEC